MKQTSKISQKHLWSTQPPATTLKTILNYLAGKFLFKELKLITLNEDHLFSLSRMKCIELSISIQINYTNE